MLPVLKKHHPTARLTMLVQSYTAEILDGSPYSDRTLLYDRGGRGIPFGELLSVLRAHGFDACFVVRPTFRVALLMALARIPVRVGTGYRWYSFLFNRRVYEHRKTAERHEVEYNLGLLKAIDIDPSAEPVEFALTIPPEVEKKVGKLRKEVGIRNRDTVVVLHPGHKAYPCPERTIP